MSRTIADCVENALGYAVRAEEFEHARRTIQGDSPRAILLRSALFYAQVWHNDAADNSWSLIQWAVPSGGSAT